MAQPQMRLACACGHVFDTTHSNTACPGCGHKGKTHPWPTTSQLEAAGFERCQHDEGCSIYIDPANVTDQEKPDGKILCVDHRRRAIREQRRQRRDQQAERRGPRVPYIPRDGRAPGPTRRDRMAARDGSAR